MAHYPFLFLSVRHYIWHNSDMPRIQLNIFGHAVLFEVGNADKLFIVRVHFLSFAGGLKMKYAIIFLI